MQSIIWKYPLNLIDVQDIEMPAGAKIRYLAAQDGVPCIWAEVSSAETARLVSNRFFMHGTGHTLHEDRGVYIGSFMLANGALVFHVYGPKEVG